MEKIMKSVSVDELNEIINEGKDVQLIDVREPFEWDAANVGGVHIPLATIPTNVDKIDKDKQVVVICRSGKRSANAIQFLEAQGYDKLYNLDGGLLAWKEEIDASLDVE